VSLKHVVPTAFFSSYFIHMHALPKYDSYLCCIPSVYSLLALVHGWLWVDMLTPAVFCLVLVYIIDNSWMMRMIVVIHHVRCGLAIVLRCWGLSKVRCGGEG
jgi:hypothetical protein